jgi:8-amino-7-oxononanoate synthase
LLQRDARKGLRPVVLSDGWCPQCGKAAPLESITGLLERYDGRLFMDDTQALGLGRGGGGLLPRPGVPADRIVSITSLAKSFGVPMAVISGRQEFIEAFRAGSSVNDHCSPPSLAHLGAAEHALELNRTEGDLRRGKLFSNVRLFRNRLAVAGIRTRGGPFPVQHLEGLTREKTLQLHRELKNAGLSTVLTSGHRPTGPLLTLLFRAGHSQEEVRYLTETIIRFHSKKCISYGFNP